MILYICFRFIIN